MTTATAAAVARQYAVSELDRRAKRTGVLNAGDEALVLFRALDRGGDFALLVTDTRAGVVVTDELEPEDFFRNGGCEEVL